MRMYIGKSSLYVYNRLIKDITIGKYRPGI